MKKPEEIKKSLRMHNLHHRSGCIGCAYRGDNPSKTPNVCADKLFKDVREYIRHLESGLNQAVEDMRMLGCVGANICPVCAHYNRGAGSPEHCPKALKEDCFEWRGVQNG